MRRLLQRMRRDDPALYKHSLQVWVFTCRLATQGLLDHEERAAVALAALLHDVGKLTIPRTLLDKPACLSPQEELAMRQHNAAGARLLKPLQIDDHVIELVSHHHERWDGQGYPEGLSGSAIPPGARLIAIVDAFATMTTSRPYQEARSVSDASQELERCAGTQFDPKLVQQCIASFQTMQHESSMETLYASVNEWLAESSLGSMTSAWLATETIG